MNRVAALLKRDVASFFSSMIAYVVIMIFLAIAGYFFFSFTFIYANMSLQMGSEPSLQQGLNPMDVIVRPLFMNLSIVILLVVPILSMRSFSEEKKQGTVELLFTYPIRNSEIVLGKFGALLSVFVIMVAPIILYLLVLLLCGAKLACVPILVAGGGLMLVGASFLSLGLFASSLTENQTIAAVLSFGMLLLFWVIGWASEFARIPWLVKFFSEISMITHFRNFVFGLIDTNDIVYYVLFIGFFLYCTFRVIEKRSWR